MEIIKEVNIDKLYSEIVIQYSGLTSISAKGNNYTFEGISDENVLQSIIDAHDSTPKELRITSLQVDSGKFYHSIDHNIDLNVTLDCEETFGQDTTTRGLLIKKEYIYNNELIFKIDYDYVFDLIRQIVQQGIVLTWYYTDGTECENVKDKGFYHLSTKESRNATKKRREAVIMLLETSIISLLASNSSGETEYLANINMGANLLGEVSVENEKFKQTGLPQPIFDKLNSITAEYPILLSELQPSYTVLQYITDFLTY